MRANINENRKYAKCIIENCDGKGKLSGNGTETFSYGYCAKHYTRFRRHGDPIVIGKITDNRSKHPLYQTYKNIKHRCYDKSSVSYKYYGEVGIKMCDEWLGDEGFYTFLADMGDKPSSNHSIDRIDVNGNYEKSNCRWATRHEQNGNTRNNNKTVGVSFDKSKNRWSSNLSIGKVKVFSKRFINYDDAVVARKNAEIKYLGYLIV